MPTTSIAPSTSAGAPDLPTLNWSAPPAPWTVGRTPLPKSDGYSADAECAMQGQDASPLVSLGSGAVFVAAEQGPSGTDPGQCGVAVLQSGTWTVFPLPDHTRLNAAAVLPGGGFVVGTVGAAGPGPFDSGTDDLAGGLLAYAHGTVTEVPVPPGQYVDSLLALPGGGYAVGTAPAGALENCKSEKCPYGEIGFARPSGQVQWFTPPSVQAGQAYGMAPFDPPYGVVVGDLQGDLLWFGVDGVGVAALNTSTGQYTEASGDTYFPGGGGPIQFFPGVASATSVYYSDHRLPGVADAGYWGPLYAVPATGGSAATSLFPAALPGSTAQMPSYGCIQGGLGAPRQVHMFGTRLWVQWSGCQVYEAPEGASALAGAGAACARPAANSSLSIVGIVYTATTVTELCTASGTATLYEFDGQTAAVTATYTWPTLPWSGAGGTGPVYAGPNGDLWMAPATLLEVSPSGAVVARYAFPGPDGAVTGTHHLWLLGSEGVASVPAT